MAFLIPCICLLFWYHRPIKSPDYPLKSKVCHRRSIWCAPSNLYICIYCFMFILSSKLCFLLIMILVILMMLIVAQLILYDFFKGNKIISTKIQNVTLLVPAAILTSPAYAYLLSYIINAINCASFPLVRHRGKLT